MRDAQDTTWQEYAACAGEVWRGRDDWFPEGDAAADVPPAPEVVAEREAAAKATCARCFVQAECLVWALVNGEEHGIWGGLNEREREALLGLGREVEVG